MVLRFNESKVTQAAAMLLKMRGGKMSYMKLLKLLYLVDREALLRWGRPVSTDRYVSMDRGPVLSKTLDLINEGAEDHVGRTWAKHISAPLGDHEVELRSDTPNDELSRAEEKLISEIFGKFGHLTRWQIVDHVHTLPEWIDPNGGAIPIQYEDILRAGNKTEVEIESILQELRNIAHLQDRLQTY